MNAQQKAKIFLAEKRGCNETDLFRSFNTFDFNGHFNKDKFPFSELHAFNDHTIAANHSITIDVDENSCLILLPVVGSLAYNIDKEKDCIVKTGQLQILYFARPAVAELFNYYENELINFIQVSIKTGISLTNQENHLITFNLDSHKNHLINLTRSIPGGATIPIISIGKFRGRSEVVFKMTKEQNKLFVFVIEGVFEVQGRLLHARDGLALWHDPADIESEALSNDAIIFMIEL